MKADPETSLRRHVVDGLHPAFREAPVRRHDPSSQEYRFNDEMPNRLTEQRRLSVQNWNPGPRRGKGGAIERHIGGKWHIITLQEAVEYLEHGFLTNRFNVTHYGGCAVLFNKDTFFSDIVVSSIYLHDTRTCEEDKVKEGESGWCYKVFRRQPRNGQKFFTVMSLHINSNYAKKRGIGKKLLLTIRAALLETSTELLGADQMVTAVNPPVLSKKRLPTQIYQCHLAPHRCGAQVQYQVNGLTYVVFIKPPDSCEKWKVRLHGAFTIPHETLGLRAKDQSCHHEVWLHLDFVDNQHAHASRGKQEQRVLLERSCPYPPKKGERQK